MKNLIMYAQQKWRYGHFKFLKLLYSDLLVSTTCKNQNSKKYCKTVVHT